MTAPPKTQNASSLREDLLHAIANTFPDPIFVLGETGTYVDVIGGNNRNKYDDPSGLIGRRLHEVMDPAMAAWVTDWVRRALDEGTIVTNEYAFGSEDVDNPSGHSGPSGKQWFEASVVPLAMTHSGERLVAWIAYNATERHEMLLQLKKQGLELENQKQQLELLANTDQLTELPNRRLFFAEFERYFARARAGGIAELAVVTLDLDHFKHVNDRFGHAVGDVVLAATGAVIKRCARSSDTVARIGGEEFAMLLRASLSEATEVSTRILNALRETPVPVADGEVPVTASIGIATLSPHDNDHYSILRRADEAMYRAKAAGRDQICVAD